MTPAVETTNYEAENDIELFATILTDINVEKALEKINEIDDSITSS